MMKNSVRFLALIIVLVMIMAACAPGDGGAGATAGGGAATPPAPLAPAAGADAAAPDDDGVPVITIGMMSTIMAEDFQTNWLTTHVEEQMGVSLLFDEFPADVNDARTRFSLMVTAGQELPHIINFSFTEIQIAEFARMGIFIPNTQFWEDPVIAPNITAMYASDREPIMRMMRMPDGEIYALPQHAQFQWNEGPFRMWHNREMLEELNLNPPRTTDEFAYVLRAVVESDPMRIGLVGGTGWGQNALVWVMNAFTYANPDRQWMHVVNGTVTSSLHSPGWVEGLRFLNMLYEEGLLCPTSFTNSGAELQAIAMHEEGIAAFIPAGSFATFGNTGPAAQRTWLSEPLTGPAGVSYAAFNPNVPTQLWFTTRDAEDPALIFSIGDFFLSDTESRNVQTGPLSVNWTRDPEILQQWVGTFWDVPNSVVFPETNVWNMPGNTIWGTGPRFERWAYRIGGARMPRDQYYDWPYGNWNVIHLEQYVPRFPPEAITRRIHTLEEMEELALIEVSISEHITANNAAFVTGQRSIDDFDNFLAELEMLQYTRFIELYQLGHDRSR